MSKEISNSQNSMPSYIKTGTNRGNENVTADDIQIPRIDVLQALSPQINEKKESYIKGAKAGILFNTLTGELYGEHLAFTPVNFVKRYLIWVDRKKDSNGGLRGVYDVVEDAEAFVSEQEDKDKLEIVPTAEHLAILDDGTEVILSMGKSKTKVSRKFNSLVRLAGGDRFSRRYVVSAVDDEGPKGEFKNLSIDYDGFPSEDVYKKAEQLYVSSKSYTVHREYEGSEEKAE